jgi:quercetin dioxygenase-like cupin family protein
MVIIVLTPNGPNVAINIPAGQWHSIRAVESGSVVLAVKDGKYEPLSDADILAI